MLPLSNPASAVHGTEPLHSRSLVELGARKPPTRPKKFKLWMEDAMASGCLAVERGESVRTVATSTRVLYMQKLQQVLKLMMRRRKSC